MHSLSQAMDITANFSLHLIKIMMIVIIYQFVYRNKQACCYHWGSVLKLENKVSKVNIKLITHLDTSI